MSELRSYVDALGEVTAPGQLFEMEEVEIRGARMRAWKSAPQSLRTVLDLSLGYGDADFVVYEDERVSFERHYRVASTLAHRLRADLGIEKGDRVAIAMRNLPEWIMAFWASVVAGAVVVPLNAWWTEGELAYGMEDSGSVVAFVDTERAARIRRRRTELPGLRTLVTVHDDQPAGPGEVDFGQLLGKVADDAVPPDVDIASDDDATIFYTSGTTGRPKGAVGTHRNTCTNLMNLFFAQTMGQLRFGAGIGDEGAGQRCYLLNVPLFHATGCHAVLITNTAAGTKLVLMHHFDPERALELIEREKVTVFGGVPTVVMRVLDSPDLTRRDTSSIRSVSYGGAPAPPELVRRIREHFSTGQASNGYGLTETSAATALNSGDDYLRKPDSVGRAVPISDVAIVPEGFAGAEPPAVPPGTVGELWVRGPHVVRGYWRRPDDTARAITHGWLHTGDVARIDDEGFITIVDRAKDVVIRGGENVYCVEVEDALFSHPAVAECAVIGIPHPVLGEEVGAVVVLRPGRKVAADELARHVGSQLAAFNVPTRLWFRHDLLPRNPAGKLLKRALRAEVLGDAAAVTEWGGDQSAWSG
ncbi:MAG: class I adenylate-forming enzyme family protein [Acidimicrobiales bacterium]